MTRISRDEALLTLDKRGPILEIAREVSRLLRESGIDGAIIGGVAVVLYGYIRTTKDVDVFCSNTTAVSELLTSHGFVFDSENKQFVKHGVPVHLVTESQTEFPIKHVSEVDDIQIVSLAELIEMKLRSGTKHVSRAQDLADVVGLIKSRKLTGEFARHLNSAIRSEFRKLVHAIESE